MYFLPTAVKRLQCRVHRGSGPSCLSASRDVFGVLAGGGGVMWGIPYVDDSSLDNSGFEMCASCAASMAFLIAASKESIV